MTNKKSGIAPERTKPQFFIFWTKKWEDVNGVLATF